jgi:Rha family phage regulatory protein
MAREATAIAERYAELGFRVIEGGKSEKFVVVNTVGFADKNKKRHDNVLRDLEKDIEEIRTSTTSDLRGLIPVHFLKTSYEDAKGEDRPCYDLTEVGFQTLALRYDAALRFQYAIAFAELQEELGLRARSITRPVTDRLQELRGDWTQPSLEFELQPPAVVEDDDDLDDAKARQQWLDSGHRLSYRTTDEMARILGEQPSTRPHTTSDKWFVYDENNIRYEIAHVYMNGELKELRVRLANGVIVPTEARLDVVYGESGKQVTVIFDHTVPAELLASAYDSLPVGRYSPIGRASLLYDTYLADRRLIR